MNRRIVCAANLDHKTGAIVIGVRHFDKFMRDQMRRMYEIHWEGSTQGFIDQMGKFLTRSEALIVAEKESQVQRKCGGDEKILISENLY